MNSTALLTSLSRPASSTRKASPTRKNLLWCGAGLGLLAGSVITLASLHLSDRQFILGLLISVVVSLALVGRGFVSAMRDESE